MNFLIGLFWNSREGRLRCGYRLLLQIVVSILLMIGFSIGAIPILYLLGPHASEDMVFGGVQVVAITATVGLACLFLDRRHLSSLGIRFNTRWWVDLVAGLLMGAGMMSLIFVIEYQMGWITLAENDLPWNSLLPAFFGWLALFIGVGISEELLSRGYHLKNISEGLSGLGKTPSFLIATVISSAFFGLLHAWNPNADFISILNICLAGVMFCIGRLCTGSLAAPIGLHITWNFFQGPVYGFAVSGSETAGSILKVKSTTNELWTGGEFGPEAGLMGVFAIFIMSGMYWCWPRDNSASREHQNHETDSTDTSHIGQNLLQLADFQGHSGTLPS